MNLTIRFIRLGKIKKISLLKTTIYNKDRMRKESLFFIEEYFKLD